MSSSLSGPAEASKPKLLDQIRQLMRLRHYSLRTEEAYVDWIRRYILFHGKRHPRDLAGSDIASFLSSLAIKGQVAASTQNQHVKSFAHVPGACIKAGGVLRLRAQIGERFGLHFSICTEQAYTDWMIYRHTLNKPGDSNAKPLGSYVKRIQTEGDVSAHGKFAKARTPSPARETRGLPQAGASA